MILAVLGLGRGLQVQGHPGKLSEDPPPHLKVKKNIKRLQLYFTGSVPNRVQSPLAGWRLGMFLDTVSKKGVPHYFL